MIPLFLSNFYPRPPRGGRPVDPLMFTVVPLFLSTPSARRATCLLTLYGSKEGISIHALREEGDEVRRSSSTVILEFLSTPSARRATHVALVQLCTGFDFYPRPPRGGRPLVVQPFGQTLEDFYPRPPRGGRQGKQRENSTFGYFYPRPPRGGRLRRYAAACGDAEISIHALREEGDVCLMYLIKRGEYFYPRPPRGGRPFRTIRTFRTK